MINEKTILRVGSTETENIKALELRLKALGYYNGLIDGSYGPVLKAAVTAYQKFKGLVQDGEAAKITLRSLGLLHTTPTPRQVKPTVLYNSDKDADLKAAATALGGKFNTVTDSYNLIKGKGKYSKYIGDKKKWAEEIRALLNNCVDWAQALAHIIDRLNAVAGKGYQYRYVRTYCVKDQVGHVYLEVKGGEFGSNYVAVDPAAGAGSKYPIGKAWCQDYPKKTYNPGYAVKDDGI